MGDLYVFNPGGSDEWKAWREEQAAAKRQIRERWTAHITARAPLNADQAELVMALLFDHVGDRGDPCLCSCHPHFDTLHDGGFDCPCTWTAERRKESRRSLFKALEPSPEMLAHAALEEAELAIWFAAHPGVTAERTCTYAPEIWEGEIDGRSFFFRERHGEWRIEIDLVPDGHFAQRYVGTGVDGEMVTEPVELTSGPEIAHGTEADLGTGTIAHLDFIVRTVRDFIRGESCPHSGARAFCPDCGARVG